MKKAFLISTTLFLLLFASSVFVGAANPSPTTSPSTMDEQINKDLQQRIASEVAQKNLVAKRGFIGVVSSTSETQLVITDLQGNQQIIDVDELTKFSSPDTVSKSFGISDIGKGTTIDAIGLFYKDSKHLLARWVDVLHLPKVYSGGILAIDSKNYTFTIATVDTQSVAIDVENLTRTYSYTKDGGTLRSGFSHLLPNERIMVVGFPDVKNPGMIIASEILVFPDIPVNPKIHLISPTDTQPITSTGSGKKLTPIVK